MIRGSISKRFLITPFERSSTSISSRFHLINCPVLERAIIAINLHYCYYPSTILQPPTSNYLMQRNLFEVFKPIYSLLNIFTSLKKNKLSLEDTKKKRSLGRIIVFLHTPSNKSLAKQQRDTLVSDCLEIKELGIYFAKEPHRPQAANSPAYLEVINFCGSQPCSPSREQRYYGLIELKPRTSIRKFFKNLQWRSWVG